MIYSTEAKNWHLIKCNTFMTKTLSKALSSQPSLCPAAGTAGPETPGDHPRCRRYGASLFPYVLCPPRSKSSTVSE